MDEIVRQFFIQFVTPCLLSMSAGLMVAGVRSLLDQIDFSRVRRNFPVEVLEDAMARLAGDHVIPDGLTWREIAQKIWCELGVEERATSTILCSPERFDKAVAAILSSAGLPATDDYLDKLKSLMVVNVLRCVVRDEALAPEVSVDILIGLWEKLGDIDEYIEDLRGDLSRMIAFQSIEAVLVKKREASPDFFREAGPLWTDFDAELVAPRPGEMRKILQSIEESRCCYVIGRSGSGKTVLAKRLAYDLSHLGWFAFYARATSVSLVDIWREISRWDKKQFLFIVDDCEDSPDLAHDLLMRFSALENCALLLLSRVSPEDKTDSDLHFAQQPPLNVTPTRRLVADIVNICERYLVEVEGYDRREMQNIRKKDVEALWKASGPDLWIVKWFLRSWDPRKSQLRSVSKDQVFRRIVDKRLKFPGTRAILLPVSVLSQMGIKASETYLCAVGSPSAIEQLVLRGVLTRDLSTSGFVYGAHHQSPARLYLEAASYFAMLPVEVEGERSLDEQVRLYMESTARTYLASNLSQLPKAVPFLHQMGSDEVIVDLLDTESTQVTFLDELSGRRAKVRRRVLRSLLDIGADEDSPGALVGTSLPATIARLAEKRHVRVVASMVKMFLHPASPMLKQAVWARVSAFLQSLHPSVYRLFLASLDIRPFIKLYKIAKEASEQIAEELIEAWLLAKEVSDVPQAAIGKILRRPMALSKLDGVSPGLATRYFKRVTKGLFPSTSAVIDVAQAEAISVPQSISHFCRAIRFSSSEFGIAIWEALGSEGREALVAKSRPRRAAYWIRKLAETQPDLAQELLDESVEHFFKEGRSLPSMFAVQAFIWTATEADLDLPDQVLAALASDRCRDRLAEADLHTLQLLMHRVHRFSIAMAGAKENLRYAVAAQIAQVDISAALEEASVRDIAWFFYNCVCLSQEVAERVAYKWISAPLVRSKIAHASLEDVFWMLWDVYQASPVAARELMSDDRILAEIHARLCDSSSWLVRPTVPIAMVGLLDLCDDDSKSRTELPEDIPIVEITRPISVEYDPSLIALSILAIHPRVSPNVWSQLAATVDCQVIEERLSTAPCARAKKVLDDALELLCTSTDKPGS